MKNATRPTLTAEQRGQLATWLAERNARVAATRPPEGPEGTLADRLRTMDAAFDSAPDRDHPLARENHELRRTVEIYEETVRQLLNGKLR